VAIPRTVYDPCLRLADGGQVVIFGPVEPNGTSARREVTLHARRQTID
jgi:hypothetical protein